MRLHRGAIGTTRDSIARAERELAAIDAAKDQKKSDAYWKAEDRRNRARARRARKNPSSGDQLSAAVGLATGRVTADNVKTVAQVAANKSKLRVKIIALCMVPILAVTFIFVANAQPTPDIVNLTGAMCHTYSTDTWTLTLERKKRLEAARDLLAKHESPGPSYQGVLTSYKGLSKERFSTDLGYAEDYVEINNTILAFAEEHCVLNIDGTELKGLWAIAQITSESGHDNNDQTKTLLQVIPSANITVTKENVGDILGKYCIVDYFKDPAMYNGKEPWGTLWWRTEYKNRNTKEGPFYTQQGPFTMQASTWTNDILKGRPSEYEKFMSLSKEEQDAIKDIMNEADSELWNNITMWCWGGTMSKQPNHADIATCGDRFYMPDALDQVGQSTQIVMNQFIKWYKGQGYTFDTEWEKIAWIRMMHWMPYFYDAYKEKAPYWIEYIKGLTTDETIAIFRAGVQKYLDESRPKGAKSASSYNSCNSYYNTYDSAFLVRVHLSALEHVKKKYPNFDETILWGAEDDNIYPTGDDGKQYTLKQMSYTLPYYIFDYMMYETLYNEGGDASDTPES